LLRSSSSLSSNCSVLLFRFLLEDDDCFLLDDDLDVEFGFDLEVDVNLDADAGLEIPSVDPATRATIFRMLGWLFEADEVVKRGENAEHVVCV